MKRSSKLPLHGQVAVVSGGAGDLGLAIALLLQKQGATVAVSDILPASKARRRVSRFHYTEVDVTRPDAVNDWLRRVEKDLGLPTLVVANAGIVIPGPALETSVEAWRRTLDVNLSGCFHMAQSAAKRLVKKRSKGRIIFIGSWAAHAPHAAITAYSVAKAGLRMLMKCMALELAPHGVTVNEVAPGRVDAGLCRQMFERHPGSREQVIPTIPVGRLMDPDDVARGVEFLCRPDNGHATGSVLLIDGGLSLVAPT